MKPENLIPINLSVRLKCRFRTALATVADLLRQGAALISRLWQGAGYYIALGVLLVALGSAAYAYRHRPRAASISTVLDVAAPEASVVAAGAFLPQPLPTPTEAPFALQSPVPGKVLQACEPDLPVWSATMRQWQAHPGIDLQAALGEAVCAAESGEITAAYRDALLGNTVEITHANGFVTRYSSLQSLALARVGAYVTKGTIIGAAGDSSDAETALGSHVHFELIVDGQPIVPDFAQADDTPDP